jgi:hypothetical protein
MFRFLTLFLLSFGFECGEIREKVIKNKIKGEKGSI